MTETILTCHPGPANKEDPDFTHRLHEASSSATLRADGINSLEAYRQLLRSYSESFKDPHVTVQFADKKYDNAPEVLPCTIQQIVSGMTWISIPTFSVTEANKTTFQTLIKQLPQLQNESCIIFDLRGNGGGDSSWGTRILTALFSEAWASARIEKLHQQEEVYWRASTENAAYLASLITTLDKQYGSDSPEIRCLKTLQHDMAQTAATHHQSLVREPSLMPPDNTPQDKSVARCPVSGTIIAIIDRRCASAALDFLDELKAVYPSAIFIGQTTGADSSYMEVRTVPLPSGLGNFTFPMKVYRNRARRADAPHIPNVFYQGDLYNTPALEAFVIGKYAMAPL